MDYGLNHYTVVYLFAKDGDGNIFVVDEHAQREWLVPNHARAIHAMLARYGLKTNNLHDFVGGPDVFTRESNGTKVADEYLAKGIRIKPANNDRVSGAANMLKLLGDMNPKAPENGGTGVPTPEPIRSSLFILERCTRLIATLPILQYSDGNPEDVKKIDVDENGRGGDDAYDACRYGLMVAFQGSSTPIFDPTTMFVGVNLKRPESRTQLWWRTP